MWHKAALQYLARFRYFEKLRDWVKFDFPKFLVGNQEHTDSYFVARNLMVRGVGLVYLSAFSVFYFQGAGLFGSRGILPIDKFRDQLFQRSESAWDIWSNAPSFFFLNSSDLAISVIGIIGIFLSFLMISGRANSIVLILLWSLHLSVLNVGQIFYGYGWEYQILDFTFLLIFICPHWRWKTNDSQDPPHKIGILFQRWMLFRLMLGAGLIKLRGDPCWTDLTCTFFHYETQPIPSPLSWYLHHLPGWFHQIEVAFTLFVELVVPFGLFGPRVVRIWSGILMIFFQICLIVSGNLSWLNWLSLVMAFSCFDDQFFDSLQLRLKMKVFNMNDVKASYAHSKIRTLILTLFLTVGVYLSIEPVKNLLSKNQIMNISFNPLRIFNSYGLFGSIGRTRYEIVISGTTDSVLSPSTVWHEYEFNCKPGDIDRRPCVITPYHLRLDWQIWFSAMQPELRDYWLSQFAIKLLENEPAVLSLIEKPPFGDSPPKFLKMDLYRYQYSDWGDKSWWKRTFEKPYLKPVQQSDFR